MVSRKKTKPIVLSELEKTLLTLLYNQSMYGMQLIGVIQSLSEDDRKIGTGSLYPTLDRMEKKGYTTPRWGDDLTGARRKYYDITPHGRSVLEKDRRFQEKIRQYRVTPDEQQTSTEPDDEAALAKVQS